MNKTVPTIIIIAFTMLIFFSSCNRTIPCSNVPISPAFVGFNITDIDTLIIREYRKDDNFQHLYDTALITNDPHVARYTTSHDTTIVVLNVISGEDKYILPNSDWQIYIPAKDTTISISNISSPQITYSCFGDDCGCANPIDSFRQNGQLTIPQVVNIPYFTGHGYITCIHN
jgi:hypothetical protein